MKILAILLILLHVLEGAELSFEPVQIPQSVKDKYSIHTTQQLTLNDKQYPLTYHTIARSGDKIGNAVFGQILDNKNRALFVSDANDFSSLHEVEGEIFMLTHFETVPAAVYLTKLKQSVQGLLMPIETKPIDFTHVGGLWLPCAGSKSPWGTHLGSEEYAPDAALSMTQKPMRDYFGGDDSQVKLYNYGWIPEIEILNKKGETKVTKHYAMGRFSHELAYVMPDKKTVYMSDDGTNVGLFMFVASKPKDLSSGHLYSARWEQRGEEGLLHWIDLGFASNAEIKKAIDSGITFSDIFERSEPDEKARCKQGFSSVHTTFGHECLKLKAGKERLASRLESRRYAALKGATTEFRKLEGITYNSDLKELYISVSEINKGMLDRHKKDRGGPNHIALERNDCGAVYRMLLDHNQGINSSFVATRMSVLIAGVAEDDTRNRCKLDAIANPDNISYIPDSATLIIGEDSLEGHENDAIWSYHTQTKSLTRILSAPLGAETTSIYYYENIKGFAYIMATIQHPFGDKGSAIALKEEDKRAYTGYFGPLPILSKKQPEHRALHGFGQ